MARVFLQEEEQQSHKIVTKGAEGGHHNPKVDTEDAQLQEE
jgi:hypothetical protein